MNPLLLATKSHTGKIGRLPRAVRNELNQRLDNGEAAGPILAWLNALPEVQTVLAESFAASPVSKQNLAQWRNGGFQLWLKQQEHREILIDFLAASKELADGDSAARTADCVSTLMVAELALAARQARVHLTDPVERCECLRSLLHTVCRVRQQEYQAGRFSLQRARFKADHPAAETDEDQHDTNPGTPTPPERGRPGRSNNETEVSSNPADTSSLAQPLPPAPTPRISSTRVQASQSKSNLGASTPPERGHPGRSHDETAVGAAPDQRNAVGDHTRLVCSFSRPAENLVPTIITPATTPASPATSENAFAPIPATPIPSTPVQASQTKSNPGTPTPSERGSASRSNAETSTAPISSNASDVAHRLRVTDPRSAAASVAPLPSTPVQASQTKSNPGASTPSERGSASRSNAETSTAPISSNASDVAHRLRVTDPRSAAASVAPFRQRPSKPVQVNPTMAPPPLTPRSGRADLSTLRSATEDGPVSLPPPTRSAVYRLGQLAHSPVTPYQTQSNQNTPAAAPVPHRAGFSPKKLHGDFSCQSQSQNHPIIFEFL